MKLNKSFELKSFAIQVNRSKDATPAPFPVN